MTYVPVRPPVPGTLALGTERGLVQIIDRCARAVILTCSRHRQIALVGRPARPPDDLRQLTEGAKRFTIPGLLNPSPKRPE